MGTPPPPPQMGGGVFWKAFIHKKDYIMNSMDNKNNKSNKTQWKTNKTEPHDNKSNNTRVLLLLLSCGWVLLVFHWVLLLLLFLLVSPPLGPGSWCWSLRGLAPGHVPLDTSPWIPHPRPPPGESWQTQQNQQKQQNSMKNQQKSSPGQQNQQKPMHFIDFLILFDFHWFLLVLLP